jgi:hypothetical protein
MANYTPTCSEYSIDVPAPKDAEGRRVPLDTKVMYDDKGIEYEVERFVFGTGPHGYDWDVEYSIPSENTIYTRPLDSTYLERPDSLYRLNEDLGRVANFKPDSGYSTPVCAYADRYEQFCDGCKLNDYRGVCSVYALKDVAARMNRLCGDSE